MNPLSVTVSVSSLLVIAARVIKVIHDIRDDYKDAEFILCSIASECTVVHTSLAHLQSMMLADSQTLGSKLTPQVTEAFDTALLGCALTLSVLDEELKKLVQGRVVDTNALEPRKLKYLVENDRLKELLQQIRGQQLAITLLLNTYQTESISDLKKAVQENHNILKQIASRARSLWQESQHRDPAQRPPEVVCGEQDSVFELSSIITDTCFDFDDEILNSRAYRRALANIYSSTSGVKSNSKRHAAVANACLGLPDEASLTIGEVSEYRKRADLEKLGERSEHIITATNGMDHIGKSALPEELKTASSLDQDRESTPIAQGIVGSNAENTTVQTTLSEHSATDSQDGEIAAQEYGDDNGDAKPKSLSHTTSREGIGKSGHVKPTFSIMDLLQATCKTWNVIKHSCLSTLDAPVEGRHLFNDVSSLQNVCSVLQDNPNIREASIPQVLRADCGTTMVLLHSTVLNILAQLHSVDSDGLHTFWESSQGTFERATMSDLQNELAVHRRRFQQYLNDSTEPPYSPTHTNKASQLQTLNEQDCEPQTSVFRPDQLKSDPMTFENPRESGSQSSTQRPLHISHDMGQDSGHGTATTKPGELQSIPAALVLPIKVVLLGDSASGKTCIIQRKCTGKRFDDFSCTIRDRFSIEMPDNFENLDGVKLPCRLEINDTAGVEDYDRMRPSSYHGVHVILVCFPIWSPDSLSNIFFKWFAEARQYMPQQPIILVGTQADCRSDPHKIRKVKDPSQHIISKDEAQEACHKLGAVEYIECSAWTGEGIDELWREVARIGWNERERNPQGAPKIRRRFWHFGV